MQGLWVDCQRTVGILSADFGSLVRQPVWIVRTTVHRPESTAEAATMNFTAAVVTV